MPFLRPSRIRRAGGADPSFDDAAALGLSPTSQCSAAAAAPAPASAEIAVGGIWRQKNAPRTPGGGAADGDDDAAESRQYLRPGQVRGSGLKLGNEIKSTDEMTFEDDEAEEEARDHPEGEESVVSSLAASVDIDACPDELELKAPKDGDGEEEPERLGSLAFFYLP